MNSVVDRQLVVDLHGCNTVIARTVVRSALHFLFNLLTRRYEGCLPYSEVQDSTQSSPCLPVQLEIITGIGRNSKDHLEPVLKPYIQCWLSSEFEPSFRVFEKYGNPGRYFGYVLKYFLELLYLYYFYMLYLG